MKRKPRKTKGRSKPSALLTRRELAARLGVHMQTVTKWERDGLPIAVLGRRGKPSLYRVQSARAWRQAREQAATTTGTVDLAKERARKERAQAELAEQTYHMRERELLPRTEVEKVWRAEVAAVRAMILSSYTASADRVHRAATLDGIPGVERELKAIAYDVLRELASGDRPIDPIEPTGPKEAA